MFSKLTTIKRLSAGLIPLALTLGVTTACANNAGVDVNINRGNQPPVISIEQDVEFVNPAPLGFYIAVGVPYDLFYMQGSYYLCRDGRWYRSPDSHGPWMAVQHRSLPPGLRKYKLERIRAYRNAEYDVYRRDRDHYHGKHFVTGKEEWKAQRKAEKEHRKEEKRDEKEYRKEMKRAEKEERKEIKRAEKEERKEHKREKHDNS